MANAYRAPKGAKRHRAQGAKPASFAKRLIKTTAITSAFVVATTTFAVTALSFAGVGKNYADQRPSGLAELALVTHKLQIEKPSQVSFTAKKFKRFALNADESVNARFAKPSEAEIKADPLTSSFLLANIEERLSVEEEIAGAGVAVASALMNPTPVGGDLPSLEVTGSIAQAAAEDAVIEEEAVELAMAGPAENPFDVIMSDPEADIPLPSSRPKRKVKKTKSATRVLAYASPTDGLDEVLPEKKSYSTPGKRVAVYDITAQKVYMPDGKIFEAHSGLGNMRDNPKYTKVKGRGPTPPNHYKLSMREKPFHGVPALRLTPKDWSKMHGRNGILAHTYLRRRPGDSAGCIAFKDYYAFLKYYKKGLVKEILVVESWDQKPSFLASLFSGGKG